MTSKSGLPALGVREGLLATAALLVAIAAAWPELTDAGGRAAPAAPMGVLPGGWRTLANGDDILSLAVQDGVVWAGTRAGGLVRWDSGTGGYTQFLRPQDPIASNTVYDIAVGADGRLWLATDRGLSVLDHKGTADRTDDVWRTYTRANSFGGLPSDRVRAVAVDGDRVWVGAHQVKDPLTGEWAQGGLGLLDTKGTPATSDDTWAAVVTFAATRSRSPTGAEVLGLVSDNINALLLTEGGKLWVATSPQYILDSETGRWPGVHGGLSMLDLKGTPDPEDDTWKPFSCEQHPIVVACHVAGLAEGPGDWVWAATRGRGAMYFRGDGSFIGTNGDQRFTRSDGLADNIVYDIATGPADDEVWLATASGLSSLRFGANLRQRSDDVWENYGLADGFSHDRIQAVAVGAAGVWAGAGPKNGVGGGVHRLTAGSLAGILRTSAAHGGKSLPANFVRDLAVGTAGGRWAGHVWVATGSREQRLFGAGAVDIDTKGTLSLADDELTVHTRLSTDDNAAAPWSGLAGDNVQAVAIAGDRVWLGSTTSVWNATRRVYDDGGLAVFDGAKWTNRTATPGGLRHAAVSSLAVGCDGGLWVGTGSPWDAGRGVDRLSHGPDVHDRAGDTWSPYSYPSLASNQVTDVSAACGPDRTWVSSAHHERAQRWSDGGAALFDGAASAWTVFDTRTGLVSYAHDQVRAEAMTVLAGPGNTAWVGAYGTRETTEAILITSKPHWPAVVNAYDGANWTHHVFPRQGWVSALARDAQGRLWVGTSRGGAAWDSIDPENWREDFDLAGIFLGSGANWLPLDVTGEGLPANDVSAIAMAPDGSVWVGTEGWGIGRYSPQDAAPTPTATFDAPSPTPTRTPVATNTRTPGGEPTSTGTPATLTPTRTPPDGRDQLIFAPSVWQRVRQ